MDTNSSTEAAQPTTLMVTMEQRISNFIICRSLHNGTYVTDVSTIQLS